MDASATILEGTSRRRFAELVTQPDEQISLSEACLLIAAEEYPKLTTGTWLRRLDDMGDQAAAGVRTEPTPARVVAALNSYLFGTKGFRGNIEAYEDPRNSFLNDVLERRTGIPVTLSILYIEVARRAGTPLPVEGISLPGHFVVRVGGQRDGLLIDPFYAGTVLSHQDCQQRLDRIFEGKVRLEGRMLGACPHKSILARVLRNLKSIYTRSMDYPRALRIMDLLILLQPEDLEERRDRGLLFAAAHCYGSAVNDLEEYLARRRTAPDSQEIQTRLVDLRHRAARVH